MGETNIPVMTQADDLDWSEKKAFCARLTAQLGFTDYEYCESRRSAADQLSNGDVAALEIRGTFTHVIREYETRRQTDCAILGLRAEESKGRAAMLKYRGMLTRLKSGRWLSNPIGDWSGMDVFALIVAKGAPYMKLYDCDELKAPHEWRMSWPLNPKYLKSGEAANLRRHFPAEWQRMVSINPQLRNYA
jgi:3'-phosphoadenosine 5'-phosphosulfate sulfotransferase (PAPS reductase)/FAD synthetase